MGFITQACGGYNVDGIYHPSVLGYNLGKGDIPTCVAEVN